MTPTPNETETTFRDSKDVCTASHPPRVADLLSPLDKASFYEQHWARGVPFLSQPNLAVARWVTQHPALANVGSLLACRTKNVFVFGPGTTRGSSTPSEARNALDAGRNLYITDVGESVPELGEFLKGIAFDLGVAPWQISLEAFAGAAGGVSSRHYDHDINFQILLAGEKEWRLEPNTNIANPLVSFHPAIRETGEMNLFMEEAYAFDARMPQEFDPVATSAIRAGTGTVLYLPRGHWHEVRSLTETWSINIVVKGVTWAEALARTLAANLHTNPSFRAYCDGYRGRTFSSAHSEDREKAFAELKQEAQTWIAGLSLADVELSPMGERRCSWAPDADNRTLVEHNDGVLLYVDGVLAAPLRIPAELCGAASKLCAFRSPFKLKHARAACPEIPVDALYNFVARLVEKNLLQMRPAHELA